MFAEDVMRNRIVPVSLSTPLALTLTPDVGAQSATSA